MLIRKQHNRRSFGAFIVNFEFTHRSGVSIADFEQVNAGWSFAKLHSLSLNSLCKSFSSQVMVINCLK